ncbi:hypothetical protein AcW1_003717 [Taiwanofungus camphoratus]|nr:hypothetical protein AcW1_003717 [Antrodia cinnamomea]
MSPAEPDIYDWPDPLAPPTDVSHDPHHQKTRAGPTPNPLPRSHTAYTDAIFNKLVVSYDKIMGNVHPEQSSKISESPGSFLAILFYGAGNNLFKSQPHLNRDILAFLSTLQFNEHETTDKVAQEEEFTVTTSNEVSLTPTQTDKRSPDTDGVQIIMPTWKGPTDKKDKFGKPWTLFLTGGSERLLWSWVICNFTGDGVSVQATNAILTTIKHKLWQNNQFHYLVDKIMAKAGIPDSANDHVVRATQSFTITLIHNTDALGDPVTIAQLWGKPITMDLEEHKHYLCLIHMDEYWIGLVKLAIAKGVECQLCKVDTHPT